MSDNGSLIVCATPIGNLGDVTARVLDALREADVIEAEDTRVTRKLLARYDIHTPLEAYHAKNLEARTSAVVERVARGEKVALVSDAGTPGVSDPGAHLVDACIEAGLKVEVLPGASAIITALVASGLPTYAFYFGGFLPRKAGERTRALEKLAALDATLVFYESPRRSAVTLADIARVLPGRQAAMARELTKIYEEVVRDETAALAAALANRELKGEVVLLVGPPPTGGPIPIDEADVKSRVDAALASGMSRKDAVKHVAAQTGVARNEVYRIALEG
ncbi:MAG: 16S rRNA (cytidine(1402)-2'-O)-methyltransferase [Coriobacteriia bacterium]|nr:16S rRNA (cytidine(1402)-2'-O)-methyltransferase [Coriobacteriia bacterium]MBN2823192.1 16S rRNA (cytidine(1402)-2'-O)-methyltransferase [Coriobacteriia bacterium]